MTHYSLKNKLWDTKKRVYPYANINEFKNAEYFFGNGEIDFQSQIDYFNFLDTTPIFDYFILWNLSEEREDDWALLDTYVFFGKSMPTIRGYLVSKEFKIILEGFKIASPYRFYSSKLKFQDSKLDYYIFQMAWDEWKEYDFERSKYYEKINDNWIELDIKVSNSRDFRQIYKLWKGDKGKYKMDIVLKNKYDIFYIQFLGFIVSEELKREIINNNITGIELNEFQNINIHFL